MATLCLCSVAFFFGLETCRAENQPHHPAACTPRDHHPGAFLFVAAFVSLAIFLFGLTSVPPRILKALGGLAAACYVGWLIAVAWT